ncbi:LOW QUALITY PROTEIN: transglutaminase-like enzyme, putative cysteine protease [Psychrobacter sp. JCM 18901]|nr:LOW QUALITY PROTEIN: transglutaminase-like enzyme, putative cysteine protease [Psychrobacter sp. JCM 18901]
MTNSKRLSSADVDALSTEYSAADATKTASFEQLALGQKVSFQPERNDAKWYRKLFALPAYYWVLIAQVAVVLPHAAHLPLWLIGFAAVSIAAQLPHIKAKFKKLSHLKRIYQSVQMLGFLLGLLGLWLTYNTAFGLDMGVAFLVLCLVSKLWELYKRRDAYVVLNLSLFVLAALFLMDQGLLTTLEVIVGAVIVLLAFIALNDDSNASGDGRLRTLGVLGVGALPLLVVLFLFFPRLPPLWSVQLSGQQATTGVSDSMSPGDFANLGQSTELAFRVEFADERPPQQQLYWRGLVFSDFDGVTWRPAPQKDQWSSRLQAPAWIQNAFATVPDESRAAPVNYKVILEPTQQNWLFGLDYPFSEQPDINTTSEFTLSKDQPVTQQLRYDVLQFAQMRIDPVLTEASRRENLALPNEGNPQARALAKQLFEQSGSDPVRYIAAIEQWINRTEFRYTLSPPRLNTNRIDEFLFETKAGFCEHYSSSFTFMLRAAGIPARVVAGYQGGEPSRNGNVWEVRQMDAHAWTEVWLEGQGWVRVDPTAFVAPERVEQGMNTMTEQQGAAMFGNDASAQISYQQYQMLQTLRRLSDQASYYWQKDVVGYDQDKQADSLLKWFNISSIMQQIIWLATSAVSVMAILVFVIWYRRRKRWHPADLPLAQLSKRVAKHDKLLARNDNEGQLAWLERLASAIDSRQGDNAQSATSQLTDSSDPIVIQTKLIEIRQNYRQLRYGRLSTFDSSHSEYQERLKQLKKRCARIVIKVFDDSVIKLLRCFELIKK